MSIAQLITLISSVFASIVSSLVLWNFRQLGHRLDRLELNQEDTRERLNKQVKDQAACKIECSREFVSAESYVRSEAYNRQKIDEIATNLSKMMGNMNVVQQLPHISGEIAASVTRQVLSEYKHKNKEHSNG
jgi:hypothetical protein